MELREINAIACYRDPIGENQFFSYSATSPDERLFLFRRDRIECSAEYKECKTAFEQAKEIFEVAYRERQSIGNPLLFLQDILESNGLHGRTVFKRGK